MNLRTHLDVVAGCLLVSMLVSPVPAQAASVTPFQDWFALTDTDEMDGSSSYHVFTNTRNASNYREQVLLGRKCLNGSLLLVAPSSGFIRQSYRGYEQIRLRVDNGVPYTFEFVRGTDRMLRLESVGSDAVNDPSYSLADLIKDMKAGSEIRVEVFPRAVRGQAQVRRYSLTGFTAASDWCQTKRDAHLKEHRDE